MNGEGSAAPAAIDYEKFRRSLKRLEEQYANYQQGHFILRPGHVSDAPAKTIAGESRPKVRIRRPMRRRSGRGDRSWSRRSNGMKWPRNYRNLAVSRPALDQEGIAESVIQRFETCYDCLWKVLKRYLIEVLGIPDPPNSPKPVFRLAHENHLFRAPVEQWLLYADKRNATAHDYNGEKAKASLDVMADFIDDAVGLYQTMSGDPWK